jgi:hypothetical protein
MRIHLSVMNESTVVDDDQVQTIAEALQEQVNRDFHPIWGMDCHLKFVPKGETPEAGSWWLVFLDDSDQAGALGYHDLTPDQHPLGKVFAKTDQKFGLQASVTASHELMEMLGDPYINLTALDPKTLRMYAYETADAVEADELGYDINGVVVSDWVTPHFFDREAAGRPGIKFDLQGHLSEPFSLAKGGYLSYIDLRNVKKGWQQEQAERTPGSRQPEFPPGSRREMRVRESEVLGEHHKEKRPGLMRSTARSEGASA